MPYACNKNNQLFCIYSRKKSKFTDFSSVLSLQKAAITQTLKTAERVIEEVVCMKQTLKSSITYVVSVKKLKAD